MATDDPTKDPYIWTGMEKLSGHSIAILTPLEDNGPWGRTPAGSGRRSWLFVGLRAETGAIDVGRVEGPMFMAGITRPQDGANLPQQAAISIGRAFGSDTEMQPKGLIAGFLSRTIGPEKDVEAAEVAVYPLEDRKSRQAALQKMDPGHAAIFGAAVADHERHAFVLPFFQGPAQHADVRSPGVVEAINLSNSFPPDTIRGPGTGTPVWRSEPGMLHMLEMATATGRSLPLAHVQTRDQAREAVADSLVGPLPTEQGARARTLAWVNDVAGSHDVLPATRATIAPLARVLAERGEDPTSWLTPMPLPLADAGPVRRADALGAALRLAQATDEALHTPGATLQKAVQAPDRVLVTTGSQMLNIEERHGRDPVQGAGRAVHDLYSTLSVALHESREPSLITNDQWRTATAPNALMERAQRIAVGDGMVSFGNLPGQIEGVFVQAKAIARGEPEAREDFHRKVFRNPVDHTRTAMEAALPPAALAVVDDPNQRIQGGRGRTARTDDQNA
jgi:hypothetical protein